jgi:predicted transcriptional regulator
METHRIYSLRARDIMNRDVIMVSPLATVYEAVQKMIEHGCQVVIVDRTDESDAYGMLTYQEIVYRVITRSQETTRVRVGDIMIKPLIVVNPNLRLPFIAQLFANTDIQNAPVIEEHKLVGIISTCDLARALVEGRESNS